MPKQNVVSVFHVIHLSHNNSTNPVITDTNQSVLADIRLSLGLPKMIAKILSRKNKLNVQEIHLQNCNPYKILVQERERFFNLCHINSY